MEDPIINISIRKLTVLNCSAEVIAFSPLAVALLKLANCRSPVASPTFLFSQIAKGKKTDRQRAPPRNSPRLQSKFAMPIVKHECW